MMEYGKGFVPRDYQKKLSEEGAKILKKYKLLYYGIEVRCGKTHISFMTAKLFGARNILFISKKKALGSIADDYELHKQNFNATIINYESLNKVHGDYDLVILDEVHSKISGFPKPSKSYKEVKGRFSTIPMILLSGTPLIESASKAYPQMTISDYSPFSKYKSFYRWFDDYGILKKKYINSMQINDYTEAKYEKIMGDIGHLIITFTQAEAGFSTTITEHILNVKMKDETYNLIKRLIKDNIVEGKNDVILADTGVKLQICLLQLFSGTIKLESGNAITIDDTKAKFVKNYFKDKKIAIMYCFVQEKVLLKKIFGDSITEDLEEFNNTSKNFMGQIVSTREGVSLKAADALVFYNIPFSGTSFVQGRDRLSHLDRKENNVYFIFAEGGIESKVYEVVKDKHTFTNRIFKKELKNLGQNQKYRLKL